MSKHLGPFFNFWGERNDYTLFISNHFHHFHIRDLAEKQIKLLNCLLQELVKGNYTYELKIEKNNFVFKRSLPLIDELKAKLLSHSFEVQVASTQIDAVSRQLSTNLTECNSFAQQLYAQADYTVQNNENSQEKLHMVLNSVKTLIQRLENVKETSAEMLTTSNESEQVIVDGLQGVMEIVQIINRVNQSSLVLISNINEFKKTFQDISNILQAVDEIANQTNLLSLNAAIESARAGEHGRGFSVVAEEIRKLSDHSKTAVSQITGLISKMDMDVRDVTNTMDANRNDVNTGVTLSEEIEKSLHQIQESYSKVHRLIQSVINITDEEYKNASTIGKNVDEVESTVEQVNLGFKGIYDAIQKQSESINEINLLSNNLLESQDGLSKLVESSQYSLELDREGFKENGATIIKMIKEEILDQTQIQMEQPIVKNILDNFLGKHVNLEAIWINDEQGKFLYSNPPAKIANAKIREWFQKVSAGRSLFQISMYLPLPRIHA